MPELKIFVVAAGRAKEGLEHAIRELVPSAEFTELDSEADIVVCIDEDEFWSNRKRFENVYFLIYDHLGRIDEIMRELPDDCEFVEDETRLTELCQMSSQKFEVMLMDKHSKK